LVFAARRLEISGAKILALVSDKPLLIHFLLACVVAFFQDHFLKQAGAAIDKPLPTTMV
jgi:hypothetical protein